jgi:hypothetical protein
MADFLVLNYTSVAPGADSNSYVLFDSSTSKQVGNGGTYLRNYRRYILVLKNSQAGTVIAEYSDDGGVSWTPYFLQAVIAATAQRGNTIGISIEAFAQVRISWVNGGVAQATWSVHQALDDSASTGFYVDSTGASGMSLTSQLPPSLGQKLSSQSLGVVQASDSAEHAAASVRAPMRLEGLVFAATSTSVPWNIPDGSIANQPDWRGKYVNFYADGSSVYIQFSTGTNASVDDAQASTVSTVNGRNSAAPQGNECWKIPVDQWVAIPVPANALTFAIKVAATAAAGTLRTHLAQT